MWLPILLQPVAHKSRGHTTVRQNPKALSSPNSCAELMKVPNLNSPLLQRCYSSLPVCGTCKQMSPSIHCHLPLKLESWVITGHITTEIKATFYAFLCKQVCPCNQALANTIRTEVLCVTSRSYPQSEVMCTGILSLFFHTDQDKDVVVGSETVTLNTQM